MLIDPKVKKLIIFNAGGGIVEREMKLSLNQGTNEFQIQHIPASFDPNSADIQLHYLKPEDKDDIVLQQSIVSLPDMGNSQQIIEREKSAANSIISYAIDFTREMREKISNICEASSYRTYADMNGIFDFIINCNKKEGEVMVKILYFVSDLRINWQTSLQVNLSEDGNSAEVEGFIIVDNKTGFSYENVELGFAIFELPRYSETTRGLYPSEPTSQTQAFPAAMRQSVAEEVEMVPNMPAKQMKRTQRMKNLML